MASKERSIRNMIFDMGTELENLTLAYSEYGSMIAGNEAQDEGMILAILNGKLEHLTQKLYALRKQI
jgi:hypothetical protein